MALRTPLSVTPHLYMGDSTGRPLDKGVVYFGEQDKDPEFYPINLFSDDALTKPLAQPVHTKGGYLYDKGDMVEPHAKELIYSVKVLDSYGRKVFYKGAMMRNSWNDDVIEQINTAIIGSADAARRVAIDITNDAINNTAVEGGVLADTFVVVDGSLSQRTINKGLESIADLSTINNPKDGLRVYVKSYHAGLGEGGGYFTYDSSKADINDGGIVLNGWVRDLESSQLYVTHFGAIGDGVTDNADKIQAAVDFACLTGGGVVSIPAGIFYVSKGLVLKGGVALLGSGSGVTILDQKDKDFNLISTPTITPTALNAINPMNEGSGSYNVANTCKKGDLIRIGCLDYWSLRWTRTPIENNGTKRKWYEAEMLEVLSATSNKVIFETPSFANVSTNGLGVEFFTPTKNMAIKGLTLRKSNEVISYTATGITITHASGVYIDDIETEYYDYAGIDLKRSVNIRLNKTKHLGGSSVTQTCYGTVYNDGLRDVYHTDVKGSGCRHVVAAGGGSGWAIPTNVNVKGLVATNSQSAGFDTHGNTAYFNYQDMRVDKMGYMEGVGHTLKNVTAIADKDPGGSFIVSGVGLNYNNILVKNHHQIAGDVGVRDSVFRDIEVISDRFNKISFAQSTSSNNKFDNLIIRCPAAANASSVSDADACLTGTGANGISSIANNGSKFTNLTLEGFPVVLATSADYVEIKGLNLINCGWQGVHSPSFGCFEITNATSPVIDSVTIHNNNANLDFEGRWFMKLEPSKGTSSKPKVLDNITLSNITTNLNGQKFAAKVIAEDTVKQVVVNNVYIDAVSSNLSYFKPENKLLFAQNIANEPANSPQ